MFDIFSIQCPEFFTGFYHLPTMADDIQEEMEKIRIESEARGEARAIARCEARGEARERKRIICAMLVNNLPLSQISEITSLPVEEILEIQSSMKDPE